MTRVVLPAIITAATSLIVAVISVTVTAMTSRRVARLTSELERQKLYLVSELEEQKAVRNARRVKGAAWRIGCLLGDAVAPAGGR
jgi:hypothetical protein